MKCLVKTCPNDSKDGHGKWITDTTIEHDIGSYFICSPCWKTIIGEGDRHSWLHKQCVKEEKDEKKSR